MSLCFSQWSISYIFLFTPCVASVTATPTCRSQSILLDIHGCSLSLTATASLLGLSLYIFHFCHSFNVMFFAVISSRLSQQLYHVCHSLSSMPNIAVPQLHVLSLTSAFSPVISLHPFMSFPTSFLLLVSLSVSPSQPTPPLPTRSPEAMSLPRCRVCREPD